MLPYSIFEGDRLLGSGSKADVALFAKRAEGKTTFIFDNATGKTIDFDLRGTEKQVLARLSPAPLPGENESAIVETLRGRGRPNQGVIGREVTLLPRHWEWLAEQPGGASAALRRLVEAARSDKTGRDARRKSRERAYYFMSAMAGDRPGFEEASRALFADDVERFTSIVAAWPKDIRKHASELAFGD